MVYKVYYFDDFVSDQSSILSFQNEYAVLKRSQVSDAKHLPHLLGVYIGVNHVALCMPKFEMDYREYLENHRDHRHLGRILLMVIDGLNELHEMGYVHRDLKPDNIGINLKPLYACVIDFDRAQLRTQATKGTCLLYTSDAADE